MTTVTLAVHAMHVRGNKQWALQLIGPRFVYLDNVQLTNNTCTTLLLSNYQLIVHGNPAELPWWLRW